MLLVKINVSLLVMAGIAVGTVAWYFIRNTGNKHKSRRWIEKINRGKVNVSSLRSDLYFNAGSIPTAIDNSALRARFNSLENQGGKLGKHEIKLVKENQPNEYLIVSEAKHLDMNAGTGGDVTRFDFYTFILLSVPSKTSVYTSPYGNLDDKNEREQFARDLLSYLISHK